MANMTDPVARAIHGTNPQNLMENILRQKIYELPYWKEQCFALTAESLVEKAVALKCVGGTFGGTRKATHFMCLVLKMLQIQPEMDIVLEYIRNEEYKYARLLGAFYLRLVGRPAEIFQYLEPLLNDYRRVREVRADGSYQLAHVDKVVNDMLTTDYLFDIALPRLPYRHTLEGAGFLQPYESALKEEYLQHYAERQERKKQEKEAAERAAAAAAAGEGGEAAPRAVAYRPSRLQRMEGGEDLNGGRGEASQPRRRKGRASRSPSPGAKKAKQGGGEDAEIAEANALRAKLGLKPLRQ